MRAILTFIFAIAVTFALASARPALARHSGGIHGGSHLFQEGVGSKTHHEKSNTPATAS